MTFAEVHVKRSVILTDRLGPDILLVLTMKRQVLHRERAHLKVPGCSLVLSALLTKKLPTFLSRLNEISGGCEKILPVSGSFWSNLKLLRMILLTAWLWRWKVMVNGILSFLSFCDVCSDDCRSNCSVGAMMARFDHRDRIATFFEELAHLLWFAGKIGVITT